MSISGSTALFLERVCLDRCPKVIVEFGTGNGVSLCALAKNATEGCVIWTVDGHEEFVRKGRERLATIKHKAEARFIHAPILKTGKPPTTWWYDPEPLKKIEGPIDLLFVDGPDGTYDRSQALPFLLDRLAPRAVIYIDDCNRARESEIFARWQALVRAAGIPFSARRVPGVERGAGEISLLREC
jgi:predicted O-methyltransferase YrrM